MFILPKELSAFPITLLLQIGIKPTQKTGRKFRITLQLRYFLSEITSLCLMQTPQSILHLSIQQLAAENAQMVIYSKMGGAKNTFSLKNALSDLKAAENVPMLVRKTPLPLRKMEK